MFDWISDHDTLLWLLVLASTATFVASLVGIPWIVVRIPADYFVHKKRHRSPWADQHPVVRVLLIVGKNVVGLAFVLVGATMLVLPGQGMLTIVVGVLLLDLPGKFHIERWLITRRPILRTVNWLRRRAHREPLRVERKDNTGRGE